jgi:hypothetical protein
VVIGLWTFFKYFTLWTMDKSINPSPHEIGLASTANSHVAVKEILSHMESAAGSFPESTQSIILYY